MKCVICKRGKLKAGKATFTLSRGDATFVVKNVPAKVCFNCGEEYIPEKTSKLLLHEASKAAKSGVEVDIRDYASA